MFYNKFKYQLTIGIPTYNRIKYISNLLCTIFPICEELNVEILVSDNCSNDGTTSILEQYSKKKIFKIIKNSTNLGFDKNVLNLFENASGNFLWLLGDDDCIDIKRISQILELIHKHPDTGLFYVEYCTNKLLINNESSETFNYSIISQQGYIDHYLHKASLISTNIINLKYFKNLKINNKLLGCDWIQLHILIKMIEYLREYSICNIIVKNKVVIQGDENYNYNYNKFTALFLNNFIYTVRQSITTKNNYLKYLHNFYILNIKGYSSTVIQKVSFIELINFYKKITVIYKISLKERFLFFVLTFLIYSIGFEKLKKFSLRKS